jgi:hypothetical protein
MQKLMRVTIYPGLPPPPPATGGSLPVAGFVLRHSQRSSTREQRGKNRETFQGDHDHPPKGHSPAI